MYLTVFCVQPAPPVVDSGQSDSSTQQLDHPAGSFTSGASIDFLSQTMDGVHHVFSSSFSLQFLFLISDFSDSFGYLYVGSPQIYKQQTWVSPLHFFLNLEKG